MSQDGKRTVLIIDDEKTFCNSVQEYLGNDTIDVQAAGTGREGLALCSRMDVDVVLLDQRLPDGNGHELVSDILARNERTKIVFITAYPTFENARQALRSGAHDYLPKPLDLEELKVAVDALLRTQEVERMAQLHVYEVDRERKQAVLIGAAGGLAPVMDLVNTAAQSDAPVLITGETGTGKNLAAKAIHFGSARSRYSFVNINCAALPENLVEAELFGYEKGAFTGAHAAKKGLFEVAEGGTLLLDEIGDMPLNLQSKLLQVIDDGEMRRIGGTSSRKVRVRIIAATNTDLKDSLGVSFRKDLYYRLSVIRIHMPPLRNHLQDIPELCRYILSRLSGGRTLQVPGDELARLMEYDWPGNVRELRNILERAAMIQQSGDIRPSLLLDRKGAITGQQPPQAIAESIPPLLRSDMTLEEAEKQMILEVLRRHRGVMVETAKALGTSLSTLKRRVRKYGLRDKGTG